jgi:hypothetical protein
MLISISFNKKEFTVKIANALSNVPSLRVSGLVKGRAEHPGWRRGRNDIVSAQLYGQVYIV